MRRFQLFEFLDQSWLPAGLRLGATRYLTFSYATTPFPALWAGMLLRILDDCGLDRIVDIGSGSGGPINLVVKEMARHGRKPRVTLTDLHPVPADSSLEYWPTPVNATSVPAQLQGLRTLFVTFHHFAPATAQAVLRDAFQQRQPICIFEGTSRTAPAIAVSLLIPVLVLLLTPFIRPLSMFQVVFTYLMPVLPLLSFWDGMVSQLRTYSVAELKELAAANGSSDFVWECGSIEAPRLPYAVSYLVGRPVLVTAPVMPPA